MNKLAMYGVRAALAVFLVGCAPEVSVEVTSRPPNDEDYQLVWNALLGRTDDPPPVTWVPGEPCKESPPSIILGVAPNITCAAGLYRNREQDVVLVIPLSSPTTALPFGYLSSSSISHEFTHAYLARSTGDPDDGHTLHPEAWKLSLEVNAWLSIGGR